MHLDVSVGGDVAELLRRFWAWIASLSGLVGLYFAADAVDLVPVFWAVVGLAALLGVGPMALRQGREWAKRVRTFPTLVERVAEAEEAARASASEVEELRLEAQLVRTEGIREGQSQVLGVWAATGAGNLELVAVAKRAQGLVLLASFDADTGPRTRARFAVADALLGDIKGVVEVVDVDGTNRHAYLACVERSASKFWEHIEERVEHDSSPPQGVMIKAHSPQLLSSRFEASSDAGGLQV